MKSPKLLNLLVCKKHGDTVLYNDDKEEPYCPFCDEKEDNIEEEAETLAEYIEQLAESLGLR